MKYKALLLDFYGTLVEEDDRIIERILPMIVASSPLSPDQRQLGKDWMTHFRALCANAYGNAFCTQRQIEHESLVRVCDQYQASADCDAICQQLFTHWRAPQPFDDVRWFLEHNSLPVCIVSNIDTDDLNAAITANGWHFDHIVTSESCRSYKPRPEMFHAALRTLSCSAAEVLHIGDSLTSDVGGAQALGIDTVWLNRTNKPLHDKMVKPTFIATLLSDLLNERIG
jgi:2-haloalkanoic acid dehalogenase type II